MVSLYSPYSWGRGGLNDRVKKRLGWLGGRPRRFEKWNWTGGEIRACSEHSETGGSNSQLGKSGKLAQARLDSASSRFCPVRRCRNGFRIQKLHSGEDVVLAAAVHRLRGEQPGRENNSSRLLRCHEPNLRHASNFVVSTVVRCEIFRKCPF